MRKYFLLGISCVLGISLIARGAGVPGSAVVVGDPFVFTFDEHGNATYSDNGGPVTPTAGFLAPDPTAGGMPGLTYILPETVINGTLGVTEPGGALTDMLTFVDQLINGANVSTLIYRSDNSDGGDALADTGFPPNAVIAGSIPETGPEGSNGFVYAPSGTANNQYFGTSDDAGAVPLPSSAWTGMALLGGLGLITVARKRRAMTAI